MISRTVKIAATVVIAIISSLPLPALAYQGDAQQPDAASAATSTAPAEQPPAVAPQTDQPKTNPAASQNAATKKKPSATKPAKKHTVAKQDPNQPPAVPSALVGLDHGPEKTVVRNGGTQDIRLQLTPTSTPEQIAERRRQTHELLAVSTENLKKLSDSQLDANQQDMLQEVHNYMSQARVADKTGELQRAVMLASKARQLSDDLVGARIFPKLWPW